MFTLKREVVTISLLVLCLSKSYAREKRSFVSWSSVFGESIDPTNDDADFEVSPNSIINDEGSIQKHYPIWKVHKYNGIDIKPLPISLVHPANHNTGDESSYDQVSDNSDSSNKSQTVDFNQNEAIQLEPKQQNKDTSSNSTSARELLSLASQLGITDLSKLPSIEEAMGLLGTTTREETIETIRELASTPEGLELIKSFIDNSSEGSEDVENYQIPASTISKDLPNVNPLFRPSQEIKQSVDGPNQFIPNEFSRPTANNQPTKVYRINPAVQYQIPSSPNAQLYQPIQPIYTQSPIYTNGIPFQQVRSTQQPYHKQYVNSQIPQPRIYQPIRTVLPIAYQEKPKLTHSLLSRTGIPSLIDRAKTDVGILRSAISTQVNTNAPTESFSIMDTIRNYFNPKQSIQNPSNTNNNDKAVIDLPPLPPLSQLPEPNKIKEFKHFAKIPIVPEFPKIKLQNGFVLQSLRNGSYIRVKYPLNGFNPVPEMTEKDANLLVNPQIPTFNNLPLDNYNAFKNGPRTVTSYGTPALPFTYSDDNTENADQQTFNENYEMSETKNKLTIVLPEEHKNSNGLHQRVKIRKTPVKRIDDETANFDNRSETGNVQPQRNSPYDSYATGRIHKANPDAVKLLPLTLHQTKLAKENKFKISEKAEQDESDEETLARQYLIDTVAKMTEEGFKKH